MKTEEEKLNNFLDTLSFNCALSSDEIHEMNNLVEDALDEAFKFGQQNILKSLN